MKALIANYNREFWLSWAVLKNPSVVQLDVEISMGKSERPCTWARSIKVAFLVQEPPLCPPPFAHPSKPVIRAAILLYSPPIRRIPPVARARPTLAISSILISNFTMQTGSVMPQLELTRAPRSFSRDYRGRPIGGSSRIVVYRDRRSRSSILPVEVERDAPLQKDREAQKIVKTGHIQL